MTTAMLQYEETETTQAIYHAGGELPMPPVLLMSRESGEDGSKITFVRRGVKTMYERKSYSDTLVKCYVDGEEQGFEDVEEFHSAEAMFDFLWLLS
jgi:hypothetical protein